MTNENPPSPWTRPESGNGPAGQPPPGFTQPGSMPPNVPPQPGQATAQQQPLPPSPPPPPGPGPGPGPAGYGARNSGDEAQERPIPTVVSLAAAAGGLLLAFSLLLFLSVDGIAESRWSSLAVAALFTVLGVALSLVARSRRAVTAGVALSALAIIPVANLLFTDPTDPLNSISDLDGYRNTQLGILTVLALVWLAAYLLSPGRRHGFYLGAALIALWQIPMTWFNLSALTGLFDTFLSPSIDAVDDPFSTDPFNTVDTFDGGLSTLSGGADDLMAKLGATALVFGLGYMFMGAKRDAAGDRRMGTPFFAVASLALITALGNLSEDLGVTWTSLLGLSLGILAIWLGSRGERRFTSWIGVASVVVSIGALSEEWLDAAPLATALALGFVGLAVTALATWWDYRTDHPEVI